MLPRRWRGLSSEPGREAKECREGSSFPRPKGAGRTSAVPLGQRLFCECCHRCPDMAGNKRMNDSHSDEKKRLWLRHQQ